MCWMLFEPMGILKIYPHIPICIILFPILKVTDRRNLIPFVGWVLRPLGVSLGYNGLKEVSSFYLP